MSKTKVLIITYYWPPAGGPGVQRWLKFVKYLPECGVQPIVIAPHPDRAEYPVRDESLRDDVKTGTEVHLTDNRGVYSLYKKFTGTKTAPYSGFANEGNPNFKQKVSRFVRGNFFLPDSRRSWNRYAFAKAADLIEKEGITTVITTGPPHSTHLIGMDIKERYNINWIADFRDPWTDIYYYDKFYPTALARRIDRNYERKVLESADKVVAVSEFGKRQLRGKSAHIDNCKIAVIPNGYDDEDFNAENKGSRNVSSRDDVNLSKETLTITYTGTLASNYDITALIDVLKSTTINYKLIFVGKVDSNIKKELEIKLGERVHFRGFVPHSESIAYLKSTDLLLLVIPVIKDNEGILTGKMFEYIGSGKRILCLGPKEGDAANIINETEAGVCLDYKDKEGIRAFLAKEYERKDSERVAEKTKSKDGNNVGRKTERSYYSRRNLTKQLAMIIRKLND